jgi:Spx/MgsR family transcriptional regulator
MRLTVYHLKNCDTCRKSIKALRAAGHDITALDVRADGVPASVLETAANAKGWEALLNTRSASWRGLDEAQRADMSKDKALALIGQYPALMKRPVIIGEDNQITIGWKAHEQGIWI